MEGIKIVRAFYVPQPVVNDKEGYYKIRKTKYVSYLLSYANNTGLPLLVKRRSLIIVRNKVGSSVLPLDTPNLI